MDIGIIIALREEFRVFFDEIKSVCSNSTDPESNHAFFSFEWSTDGAQSYSCVATLIGDMGPTTAALTAQRLQALYDPLTIVNIGIAGCLSKDVRVADIIIAKVVDSFMESSKAVPGNSETEFVFQLSGEPYRTSGDLTKAVTNFEFIHADAYRNWLQRCKTYLDAQIDGDKQARLLQEDLIHQEQAIFDGHIASGITVGASAAFASWLRSQRDRAYLGIEMEAGGVMTALHSNVKDRKSLIIRGVSDLSDERKAKLDSIGTGALRRVAMYNAIQFLWTLLGQGILPHSETVPIVPKTFFSPNNSDNATLYVPNKLNSTSAKLAPDDTDQDKEASWYAIKSKLKGLKDLINSAGVARNHYARFIFLHRRGEGDQYNRFEGRDFDGCIDKDLIVPDTGNESYYWLNTNNRRNLRAINLINEIEEILEIHESEFDHDEHDLFGYSFDDADFWQSYVGYKVT